MRGIAMSSFLVRPILILFFVYFTSSCGAEFHQPAAQDTLHAQRSTSHALPWPAGKSYRVTRGYHTHAYDKETYAIDFATKYDALVATTDGWVRLAKGNSRTGACKPSYGKYANYVVLYWSDGSGKESLYLHLSKLAPGIEAGVFVKQGTLLGYSGDTGYTCGAHLHYQVQKGASSKSDRTTSWWLQSVAAPFDEGTAKGGTWLTSENDAP